MPSINLLSREISELIAAGEVIERPASVIKELVENSIDAGSQHITVEIKRGGSTFIRITDDGCGISFEDVPKAFLRHATSKITSMDDLNSIMTLGFRGEALASVCAVARVEVMTKQPDDELGTHYIIEGSDEVLHEKTGCPDGTTIIIRDLFYNVPARQKFMKKDVAEGNMVCNIINKIALSHSEIAFKMIRDNKLEFTTAGDGNLYSSVYAVYGKNFACDMIEVNYSQDGIKVSGYCVKPLYSKANRTFQNFFVNNRYIKSQVCTTAVEEAYRGLIMTGKFPACVLKLEIPPDIVDVNVHPAKIEVRFSDDKPVYSCLYFAIKSALMKAGLIYDFQLKKDIISDDENKSSVSENINSSCKPYNESDRKADEVTEQSDKIRQNTYNDELVQKPHEIKPASHNVSIAASKSASVQLTCPQPFTDNKNNTNKESVHLQEDKMVTSVKEVRSDPVTSSFNNIKPENMGTKMPFNYINSDSFIKKDIIEKKLPCGDEKEKSRIRYIGEAFKGYIIAEVDEKVIIIDKHAAHERILFERLKAENKDPASQLVLGTSGVLLSLDEADALSENVSVLENMGFKLDFSNSPYVCVKAIPTILEQLNMDELIPEIAENFRKNKLDPRPDALDDILHSIACKAAIRINDKNSAMELQKLAEDVYGNEKIRHCPHGRPVMFTITKYEMEKQFKRRL